MSGFIDRRRRLILGAALSGVASRAFAQGTAPARPARTPSSQRMAPLRYVDAGPLNVGYYEAGPADGPSAILLHGFPYDIHSYADVAALLAAQGCRVIVPYLRGFGATQFRDLATLRSGEQAALGADVIALMDALGIRRAVIAGHNWGGRAACVAAALWPDRCGGMVTVNSYLVQDIARAMVPIDPRYEVELWYGYYFQIERGHAGLAANRREIARMLWEDWSPDWEFDDATFERTATAHDNPDYVDVVIHSYRHRFALRPATPPMPSCSAVSRRCRRSRCRPSRWTAMPTACFPPATAAPARRNLPAAVSTAWCRAPVTTCRRKRRKRLPRR
jgi:pimeloyl-ACP methyl ester carboxylesterase